MLKKSLIIFSIIALILLYGCGETKPAFKYKLVAVHPAAGRQGVCTEGGYYRVSGSGPVGAEGGRAASTLLIRHV
jgi:hypothetical protein